MNSKLSHDDGADIDRSTYESPWRRKPQSVRIDSKVLHGYGRGSVLLLGLCLSVCLLAYYILSLLTKHNKKNPRTSKSWLPIQHWDRCQFINFGGELDSVKIKIMILWGHFGLNRVET